VQFGEVGKRGHHAVELQRVTPVDGERRQGVIWCGKEHGAVQLRVEMGVVNGLQQRNTAAMTATDTDQQARSETPAERKQQPEQHAGVPNWATQAPASDGASTWRSSSPFGAQCQPLRATQAFVGIGGEGGGGGGG
jgi:hypothetical protein